MPPVLQTALDNELDLLRQLCSLTLDELLDAAGAADKLPFLPRWETKAIDLHAAYAQRMSEVGKKGYGMFAKHHVFTVENGQLVPVRYPDPQRLDELPGYEQEREKVISNTRALLAGMPANNVLLYGDAGTGKSSTVKAIANEFVADGLRLVEVKKNQLYQIPDLMDKLAANPLKFILFIDDLSFTANDDNFAALKAILEGSVGGRARNIAVYATSNRHLPAARESPVRGHPHRAGQTARHRDAPRRAADQGRSFRHPCRRPQPPRRQAVHRAVRRRSAEVNKRNDSNLREFPHGIPPEAFSSDAPDHSAGILQKMRDLIPRKSAAFV